MIGQCHLAGNPWFPPVQVVLAGLMRGASTYLAPRLRSLWSVSVSDRLESLATPIILASRR